MLKIGDFSKLAQVSTRTLRYYDELGLLKPQITDTASGYRYYTVTQLPRLNRILALKDLGFELDRIAHLLDADVSPAMLHESLVAQERELETRIEADQARLRRVRHRLQQIESDEHPALIDVVLKSAVAQPAIGNRMIVPTQPDLMFFCNHMLAEVYRWLRVHDIPYLPAQLILYHAQEYVERDMDTEVAVLLPASPPTLPPLPHNGMRVFELPAAPLLATVTYYGALQQAGETTRHLVRWVEEQGYGYPDDGLMMREIHLFEHLDTTRPIPYEGTIEFQLPIVAR